MDIYAITFTNIFNHLQYGGDLVGTARMVFPVASSNHSWKQIQHEH